MIDEQATCKFNKGTISGCMRLYRSFQAHVTSSHNSAQYGVMTISGVLSTYQKFAHATTFLEHDIRAVVRTAAPRLWRLFTFQETGCCACALYIIKNTYVWKNTNVVLSTTWMILPFSLPHNSSVTFWYSYQKGSSKSAMQRRSYSNVWVLLRWHSGHRARLVPASKKRKSEDLGTTL